MQAKKERKLEILLRRTKLPEDKSEQAAFLAHSEHVARQFHGEQAEIAMEMATLLCNESSAKPGSSKKVCTFPSLKPFDFKI